MLKQQFQIWKYRCTRASDDHRSFGRLDHQITIILWCLFAACEIGDWKFLSLIAKRPLHDIGVNFVGERNSERTTWQDQLVHVGKSYRKISTFWELLALSATTTYCAAKFGIAVIKNQRLQKNAITVTIEVMIPNRVYHHMDWSSQEGMQPPPLSLCSFKLNSFPKIFP